MPGPYFPFWALLVVAAQEEPNPHLKRSTVSAGFGFTFIKVAGGVAGTEASGLFVPSLGLDYYFKIHKRWAIGLMANYELDHYYVLDGQVERDNALLLNLVGMFDITEHWGVFIGGGIEIEPHDHLGVFRLGTLYTIDLKKNWALIPKFHFDFKENYDTWSLQLSVGKKF